MVVPIVVLVILCADQFSVHFFKNVFLRYRPCHNLAIADLVHVVDGCGGKYGFVSSHATNTFGLAVYLGLILKPHIKWMFIALLAWATLVSYSRVYVGVHYPADILGGAILGSLIALFYVFLYRLIVKKTNL